MPPSRRRSPLDCVESGLLNPGKTLERDYVCMLSLSVPVWVYICLSLCVNVHLYTCLGVVCEVRWMGCVHNSRLSLTNAVYNKMIRAHTDLPPNLMGTHPFSGPVGAGAIEQTDDA